MTRLREVPMVRRGGRAAPSVQRGGRVAASGQTAKTGPRGASGPVAKASSAGPRSSGESPELGAPREPVFKLPGGAEWLSHPLTQELIYRLKVTVDEYQDTVVVNGDESQVMFKRGVRACARGVMVELGEEERS